MPWNIEKYNWLELLSYNHLAREAFMAANSYDTDTMFELSSECSNITNDRAISFIWRYCAGLHWYDIWIELCSFLFVYPSLDSSKHIFPWCKITTYLHMILYIYKVFRDVKCIWACSTLVGTINPFLFQRSSVSIVKNAFQSEHQH